MSKKYIYKLTHIIGLLAAVTNVALVSFEIKTLLAEESLPLKLLVLILSRVFIIFMFFSIYAGAFDSLIAKIINDDSKKFVSLSTLLSTRKEFLYKIFIHWGGIFLIFGMFTFNWISYDMKLIYTQIIGITDLHIFLLCAFLIIIQKEIFRKEILIFLAISIFYIAYSLDQGHSLVSTLQAFKDNFSVIWLYIFFKHFRFKNETITHYINFLKLVILLQPAIQLIQFIILRDVEFCSGTFGYHATGIMGVFIAGVVLYLISLKRLDLKNIFLIIYLSISPFIGSSRFFFVISFFLVPLILLKKYKMRISSKIILIVIICIIFLGFLQFNKIWYEEGGSRELSRALNPFYYFSGEFYRHFFEVDEATLQRGGAVRWVASTLKDENKLFAGRGVGWFRSLTSKEIGKFKKLTIGSDFPMIFLLCGISGLLIFLYLAYNLFKMRIRITSANPELKIFIFCLALLYLIGGIYTQGWISRTTGYCFAMLIGILSNKGNKKFFIEKYLKQNNGNA